LFVPHNDERDKWLRAKLIRYHHRHSPLARTCSPCGTVSIVLIFNRQDTDFFLYLCEKCITPLHCLFGFIIRMRGIYGFTIPYPPSAGLQILLDETNRWDEKNGE